ncbi:MAG TPA: hypothetical protein VKP00_06365, partial [Gemmatimonadaceae bacterium]|nr:hypothetical protein [Gemmatimonadaceae bacterium]
AGSGTRGEYTAVISTDAPERAARMRAAAIAASDADDASLATRIRRGHKRPGSTKRGGADAGEARTVVSVDMSHTER